MNSTLGNIDVSWVSERSWDLIIDGRSIAASGNKTFENLSPVTGRAICTVADATVEDVDIMVESGKRAFDEWRRVPVAERAKRVRALAGVLREHREELAALDAIDIGNSYSYMLRDVELGAEALEYMADLAHNLTGTTLPASETHLNYTRREPWGVVARIVAFNHPIWFAVEKVAAPLVAGNAVIVKPSDASPLSALRMGELFAEHLPKGLVNVLVGQGIDAPRALVRHPGIRRIGFIGSEPTGRSIQKDAAESGVKNVTLELGGKNAIIVCPDAGIDEAAAGIVKGMNFAGWQSQSCGSTSRLLVYESIADEIVDAVVEKMRAVRIGSPLHPDTQMGTMVNERQFDKVVSYINIAKDEGAKLVTGGGRPEGDEFSEGYYVEPTLFDGVTPDMRIANEEVFGPILSVIRWSDIDEAVRIANSVPYGLTGSVFTRDVSRAHQLANALDAGYVWINDASTHFRGQPFGGFKASGIGKEESLEELISYTQEKAVNVTF